MVTEAEAREMMAAIKLYQAKDDAAKAVINVAEQAAAQGWFNALPQINNNPATRAEALANYNTIEALLQIETDKNRLVVLRKELSNANEVYKQVKKNGS